MRTLLCQEKGTKDEYEMGSSTKTSSVLKMSTYAYNKKSIATLPRPRMYGSNRAFYMKETRSTIFPLEVINNPKPTGASVAVYLPRASDSAISINPAKPAIGRLRDGYGDGKDVRRFSDGIRLKKNVDGGLIAKASPNPLVFIQRNKVYEGNGPTNVSRFYRRQAIIPRSSDGFKHRSTRFDKVVKK